MKNKKSHTEKMDELALDLIDFLQKNNLFHDITIYVNQKRLSSNPSEQATEHKTPFGAYYVTNNINVAEFIEYNNPDTITMSFEGPLYHMINYGSQKEQNRFENIFKKYGLYTEQGYAWSLAAYPLISDN